jgi:putative flippase GtrA
MTDDPSAAPSAHKAAGLRQGAGFATSGALAFATDAIVLKSLTAWTGLSPFLARLIAIAIAMVVGWLSHRRLTFAVKAAPSLAEFLRYAALAWTAAAINYGIFAVILLLRPETEPLLALLIATVVSMCVSYIGMRFGVFRKHA